MEFGPARVGWVLRCYRRLPGYRSAGPNFNGWVAVLWEGRGFAVEIHFWLIHRQFRFEIFRLPLA